MNDKDFSKSVYWTVGMLLVHCMAGCGLLALLVLADWPGDRR